MNCHQTSDQLHAFHDGELAATGRREFEDHLSQCGECRGALASLHSLRAFVSRHGHETAPSPLSHRILLAAAAHQSKIATPRAFVRWCLPRLAAAGLGAIFIGSATLMAGPRMAGPNHSYSHYSHGDGRSSTATLAGYFKTPGSQDAQLPELRRLQQTPEGRILTWAHNGHSIPHRHQNSPRQGR